MYFDTTEQASSGLHSPTAVLVCLLLNAMHTVGPGSSDRPKYAPRHVHGAHTRRRMRRIEAIRQP